MRCGNPLSWHCGKLPHDVWAKVLSDEQVPGIECKLLSVSQILTIITFCLVFRRNAPGMTNIAENSYLSQKPKKSLKTYREALMLQASLAADLMMLG